MASIAIFQVISLEGWVDIMYYIQDAFSFWSFIYFFCLVLLGSYFAVKLCLVIIAAQFQITRSQMRLLKQIEQSKKKQAKKRRNSSNASSLSSFYFSEGIYQKFIDGVVKRVRKLFGCFKYGKDSQLWRLVVSVKGMTGFQYQCPECSHRQKITNGTCEICQLNISKSKHSKKCILQFFKFKI